MKDSLPSSGSAKMRGPSAKLPADRAVRAGSLLLCSMLVLVGPAHAAIFVVDSTGDGVDSNIGNGVCRAAGNVCTLRAAIQEANALAGTDTIHFNIGGGGPQTISPASALPTITTVVIIDGTTQPGFAGTPIIELSGVLAPSTADGLILSGAASSGSTIRGLVIGEFDQGIRLVTGTSNNIVTGNYVGTNKAGTGPNTNAVGVFIQNSPNNRVGGLVASELNVISANNPDGIQIVGASSTGNLIQGNYIGLDASGTVDLGNGGQGVAIFSGAANNTVGGTVAGARNVISGNGNQGVGISSSGTSGNRVEGNFIGTDVTGTLSVPNLTGVGLQASTTNNTIGGAVAGAGNLLSGNNNSGLLIDGASGNTIQNNRIGTDVSGTAPLSNGEHGIHILNGSSNNLIGGAGLGNLISGNDIRGIDIGGASTGNVIEGNIIGRNATNTASIPNLTGGVLIDSSNNRIGGTAANVGNVIAGNSVFPGVALTGGATGNAVLQNAIFANAGLGIDLGNDGVTANDTGDVDTGPNDRLNWPFIYKVSESGGTLTVDFALDLQAGSYRIEFFENPSGADPSGNGEGETFAGSLNINHTGSGPAAFSHGFPGAVGDTITATTTVCTDGATCAAFGSTSEFSNEFTVGVTAVELLSFTAAARDSAVELFWQTASELNNLGFHLYRAASEGGRYERVTGNAIPGLGSSPTGAKYGYRDEGLTNGVTYYYMLEDVDTTGATELHGPVPATPGAAKRDSSEEGAEESRITFGDPLAGSLKVLRRSPVEVVLELETGGFYAEPREDGSVRLSVPGFEALMETEPNAPGIPVKRSWIEALAGRRVNLVSVTEREVEVFAGLAPASADEPEIVVGRNGTFGAARCQNRRVPASPPGGLYPSEAARVASVGFQGEVKKALVELAPLRWDSKAGRLLLARRLVVRLSFRGREPMEDTTDGVRGRRRRADRRARGAEIVRLATEERGLHAISFEEIFGGRRRPLEASELRLSRQGADVAYRLEPRADRFGPGSTLYFLSEGASANPWGDEAIYELELAPGGRTMEEEDASPAGDVVPFYRHTLLEEENRYYQAALVDAPDLWLWELILAPATRSFPFRLDALASTAELSRLSVWLQGASDLPEAPDHHLRLLVNDILVNEPIWNGKEARKVEVDLPPGVLREGDNVLEIENVGDTGAAHSMVMLDRFEVHYPRPAIAVGGRLEGSWSVSGVAELRGLGAAPLLLDTTEARPRWLKGAQAGGDGITRARVQAGRRYLAVSPDAALRPEIRRVSSTGLASERNGADYIVLAPEAFLPEAAPLLELRRGQGLRVKAVSIESVYSEFGFGEARPEAVKDFLSHAYHTWERPSPRYVVLLGDATYDFKDYLGTGVENHVPPLMLETTYLWTASDPSYAAVNGEDVLPDLALGRLPAASLEEARVMVEKIVAFETLEAGLDTAPVVLVADNADRAGNFVADAEELASSTLAGRDVRKIYLSELGLERTRGSIRKAFDEGASVLSYVGHGGIHLWAGENLFDISQVESLSLQPRQPIVLTMNCLNGYFHFPYFGSLAEELLKAEGRGAVAAFSPSGMSLNGPAHDYHRALLKELLGGAHERLGDAVMAAQNDYARSGAFPELLSIYHLLGDPALRLR